MIYSYVAILKAESSENFIELSRPLSQSVETKLSANQSYALSLYTVSKQIKAEFADVFLAKITIHFADFGLQYSRDKYGFRDEISKVRIDGRDRVPYPGVHYEPPVYKYTILSTTLR